MLITFGKRCRKCKTRDGSRLNRNFWMHLLLGSRHYQCERCNGRYLSLFFLFSVTTASYSW